MKVLVADDDATSRLLLKTFVARLGHECVVVDDGDSAWEQLQTDTFDVLLTDWMMPGADGPELCRRQRRRDGSTYTYIVLVTSLDQHDKVLAGMEAGADDYLTKPVDPFHVETRLVAAERVTALHRQVKEYRARLERANVELLDQSRTDPLTGLGNRRRMEEDLDNALSHARRHHTPVSVVLFDVDHFKAYNDRHGHPTGDEALRRVGCLIAGACRAEDTAYRYGGEEFLVLMRGSQSEDALAAGERIRRTVEHAQILHGASPVSDVVTLSGGISTTSPATLGVSVLLQSSDEALYEAKSRGRNQIALAEHLHHVPAC